MKKVAVSVTNDLVTDQRVMRTISVLQEQGFEVTFIGRQLAESLPFEKPNKCRRFKLWFRKGALFYANYNLRLFFYLLFKKFDIFLSNDLDTLLPNFLVSKIKNKPLIYDSHEYFTGVPEIQNRPLVRKTWQLIEKCIFPNLKNVVTVNESIAKLYENEYDIRPKVVRNISDSRLPQNEKTREELGLPVDAFLLINQGAGINVDRGMEEMLEALSLLPQDVVLLIVGSGDAVPNLKKRVSELELENRVKFISKKPYLEMLNYTISADCGLSLDKPTSPNYRFSLPNKVFDYIKCGLPLVVSNVVEVKKVVEDYKIGEVCGSVEPQIIAEKIVKVRKLGKQHFSENLKRAASENNWEKEKKVWEEIFRPLK